MCVSVWFAGTILITYGTCLMQGHCGGLPLWSGPWDTISHSWEEFPGNMLSRFVVGYCCEMICVFHCMLYVINTLAGRIANGEDKRCCCCYTNKVLLGLGAVACFCLTWVGAICDAANDPQCEGNNTIHSTCAVIFFLFTDVVAGVLACDPRTEAAKQPKNRVVVGGCALGLALTTMHRVCRLAMGNGMMVQSEHPSYQHGDNVTIIIEVAEVAFFLVFLNNIAATYMGGLSWAAVRGADAERESVLVVSAHKLAHLAAGLLGATLLVSYGIQVHKGNVEPLPYVPGIGELWEDKPTNWIGRWGLVQSSAAALWTAIFASAVLANGKAWAAADYAVFVLQAGGALALAGVGMVNLSENADAHKSATSAFFVLADLGAALFVMVDASRHAKEPESRPAPRLATIAAALACALSTLRFVLPCLVAALGLSAGNGALFATEASLEWANCAFLAAFWVLNLALQPGAESMACAILIDTSLTAGSGANATKAKVSKRTIDLI